MTIWSDRRISALATINNAKNYLEIGIEYGSTFNNVNIAQKTGVDVSLDKYIPNLDDKASLCKLYEQSSTDFFRSSAVGIYDLIFIDGLHTSEQTFRDFISSLNFSSKSTIWLIDDVLPSSPLSSVADLSQWHKLRLLTDSNEWQWHGDVFRSILLMRASFDYLNFATIADGENGQTVIWFGKNPNTCLNMNWEEIARFSYFDLISDLSVLNCCTEEVALATIRDSWI